MADRNVQIMGQGRPEAQGAVTIRGTAVPTVTQAVDPQKVAFEQWLMKAHPELTGLGGGARRMQMMPQLMQEFAPIWQAMQMPRPQPSPTPGAGAPVSLADIIAAGGR